MSNDNDDRTVVRSSHLPRPRGPSGGYTEIPGNALPIGTRLGEFEILGLIGEGGFGIVYLAQDHSLNRQIALKEYMPSGMAQRTQAMYVTVRSRHFADTFQMGLRSFVNEARMLARFDSPSLVKVYRFWEENGTAYMVMPFYEGITLKQALKEGRIVPDEAWIRALLANLLDAIETIHQENCYHRDIAPDNILLLNDGRPLLLDFGAARRVIGDLTQGPTVILKPGFAPIEQYADIPGLRQGAWTDIYALGAVVYYLITGKPPIASVGRAVNDDMIPLSEAGAGSYSARFLATIDKALAVRPEHRIQSVAELRDALGLQDNAPRTMPHPFANTRNARPATDQMRTMRTGGAGNGFGANTERSRMPPAGNPPAPRETGRGKRRAVIAGVLLSAGIGAAFVGNHFWKSFAPTPSPAPVAESPTGADTPASPGPSVETESMASSSAVAEPPPSTQPEAGANAPPRTAAVTPNVPDASPPAPANPPPVIAETKPGSESASPPMARSTPVVPAAPPAPAAPALSPEDELWRAVTARDSRTAYEAYLKKYPRGKHADTARVMLDELKTKQAESKLAAQNRQKTEVPDQAANEKSGVKDRDTGPTPPNATARGPAAAPAPTSASKETETAQAALNAPTSPAPATSGASSGSSNSSGSGDAGSGTPPVALKTPREPPKNEPTKQLSETVPPKQEPSPPKAEEPAPSAPRQTLKLADQTMVGSFTLDPVTGSISGTGQITWNNGDRYEGRLVKGLLEGKGKFTWANGQQYTGDFVAGKPNGKGVLRFANGDRYEGDFKDGRQQGQGTTRFKSGDTYSGSWVKGKENGQGRYTWNNGSYWEGEFRDGVKTENGQLVQLHGGGNTAAASAPSGNGSGRQEGTSEGSSGK